MPADGATLVANADDLTRLYDEYGPKIYRYCLGRLRSKEDAEDAQQNTFLRAYTALRQGTVPAHEAAWLYKIAHNVCLSRVESGAARSRVETPRDLAALEAELAAPSGRRDELIGLEDALAELPANLRQAILLREWQGLSYTEIAEALGVSVSAVETLIFRARRRLAQTLEQGVVRPAKRVATALNLPWLYDQVANALRALVSAGRVSLTAAGPAKIVVAAALVAAGGGGVGAGLALGTSHGPGPMPGTSLRRAGSPLVTRTVRQAERATGHRAPPADPSRAGAPTSLANASGNGVLETPVVLSLVPPETGTGTPAAPPASGPLEARPAPAAGTPVAAATPPARPATTPVSTTVDSTTAAVATTAVPIATPTTPAAPTVSAPVMSAPELPSLPAVVDPAVVGTTQAPATVLPSTVLPSTVLPSPVVPVVVLPLPALVTTAVSPLHP